MIVKKKTWPELFELVKQGRKKFDLRVADFNIREGDTLVLEEWDPKTGDYTGRKISKKVGYVLKFNLGDFGQEAKIKENGLLIISLDELNLTRGGLGKVVILGKKGSRQLSSF